MYALVKRFFDIVFGVVGTIFLVPIAMVVVILNFMHGDFHNPFLVQRRIGKDGKIFKMFKFRSMVTNADEELERLMEENPKIRKEYQEKKKIENDPRITKAGAIIRRFSIDETPQFLNVLIGNMSVVGNRPYLLREKKEIPKKYYDEIIKTKPGLTGIWQVSGHNDVSFKDRVEIEALYSEIANLRLDMSIVLRTFKAMFGVGSVR